MKLKSFNQALALAIERYTTSKKYVEQSDKYEKEEKYNERFDRKYRYYMCDTVSFFVEAIPKFIKKNNIKDEKLTKLAIVMLKTTQLVYLDGYGDNIMCYFNQTNMKDESLLKELAKAYDCDNLNKFAMEKIFVKYNFEYLENYVLLNCNLDKTTHFAIDYKDNKKLHLKQFENKILDKGSFNNLYDYLYEVKKCNQKAVLTKILEIATPEELKRFSHADEDVKKLNEARDSGYSLGYSLGYDPY